MSYFFSSAETKCKCGCDIDNVASQLLNKLDHTRSIYGEAITLSSCCRCIDHNDAVGGSPTSSHITTSQSKSTAADIVCKDSEARYGLITALLEAGFTRIGIADGFLHVDVDNRKSPNVIWTY